ncbi:MAG: hypothetical protein ACREFE_15705 [Limisphaerales bacterium]
MKIQAFQKLFLIAAIAPLSAMNISAQNSSTTAASSVATASNSIAPVQLSYGVPQVLQLAQAKVGDDTIVAYIQNSGTIYALDANQIVYLRQQGVSDRVVTAMLNQRKNVLENAAQTQTAAQNNSTAVQTSTTVAQPTYETVPSSSVYVIPDTQTYNYDSYYYQPYYYPYYGYGWSYPAVSFSFGFHGGYRGGYYHGGGFHGGGWRGGGFHGGGWHHH